MMAEVQVLHPAPPKEPLPLFEGRPVEACQLRIIGTTPLDDVNLVVSVDDRVRLVGEYKVVSIRHFVDPKTGDLVREQVMKPTSADVIPWNPADPNDDGVVRAYKQP